MREITTDDVLAPYILKTLSNVNRLAILQHCVDGISQVNISKILGVSNALISQYVTELEDMGLVEVTKANGRKIVKTIETHFEFRILPIPTSD